MLHDQKTVLFLHIPKTAGTTLRQIAAKNYDSDSIHQIDGKNVQKSVNEFKMKTVKEKKKIKFLQGHFSFGLHEFLPQESTYITVLREPIDRLISTYYYLLTTPSHPFHLEVKKNDMSFEECLESNFFKFRNNSQVRMLSGTKKVGVNSAKRLERAKYNLDNFFSIVGVTEEFDDFLVNCQQNLGWKTLSSEKKVNVTKKRPKKENISDKALKTIKENNALDIELYNFTLESIGK